METTNQNQNPVKTPDGKPVWPSEEEQREYWRRREREAVLGNPAALLHAIDAYTTFFDELQAATAKLKKELECLTGTTSETKKS